MIKYFRDKKQNMESQPQMQQEEQKEEQPLETTPVIVSSPDMENKVSQSSVWWVLTGEHERRPFYVVSSTRYNEDSKKVTGFWLNEHLNKSVKRNSVKVNFKDTEGEFQVGWVNVTEMCHMETKELDSTLGQSTKGFVYKVMDHFSRKVVGTFRENNNHQYTTNRGRGRGRGGRGGSHYRKRQPENTQQTPEESVQTEENN